MLNILSVFLGGAIGSVLRYLISLLSKKYFLTPVIGTFFVNIIGCFIIGLVFGLVLKSNVFPNFVRLFIISGFLGGLTTFSSFNLEIFELIKEGKIFLSLAYLLLSLIFGLLSTYLGFILSGAK
mgnify:CR=1 FL=1